MIFVDVCDGIKRLHTKIHLSDCLSFGRSLCIMHSNQCFSEWFWDKWFLVKRRSIFLPTVIFSMPVGHIFHKVSKSVWIIQKHFVYHITTFPSVSIFLVIATMIIIWINIKRNFCYNHHLAYFMLRQLFTLWHILCHLPFALNIINFIFFSISSKFSK